MKQYSDLEYLRLSRWQKFVYKLLSFFSAIPLAIGHFFANIGGWIKKGVTAVADEFKDIGATFIHGDWKTKVSYVVMGFGNLARGQILRGLFSVFLRLYLLSI